MFEFLDIYRRSFMHVVYVKVRGIFLLKVAPNKSLICFLLAGSERKCCSTLTFTNAGNDSIATLIINQFKRKLRERRRGHFNTGMLLYSFTLTIF